MATGATAVPAVKSDDEWRMALKKPAPDPARHEYCARCGRFGFHNSRAPVCIDCVYELEGGGN